MFICYKLSILAWVVWGIYYLGAIIIFDIIIIVLHLKPKLIDFTAHVHTNAAIVNYNYNMQWFLCLDRASIDVDNIYACMLLVWGN